MKQLIEQLIQKAQELSEEHIIFDSLFSTLPAGIGILDMDYNIVKFNPVAVKIYNAEGQDIIGKKCYTLMGKTEPCIGCLTTEVYKTHKTTRKENYYADIDIWLDVTVIPRFNEKGEFIGVIEHYYDITEFKTMEEELKDSNEQLTKFAYVVSHDLQEPIRVVTSYCQLLEEAYDNDNEVEAKRYLSHIHSATGRMKRLIKDLLDYARVGRTDNGFENNDLNTVVQEVVEDFELYTKDNAVEIKINHLPSIFARKTRMIQIFHNLISNGVKFRRKDVKAVVEIGFTNEEDKNFWHFYVKDNGIGIAAENFDKLFEVFRRLHSQDDYPGSGIGLAICKRIVESHGGDIWIESKLGEGTTCYFTISKHLENSID